MLCSWDAEEYGLLGSTEFVEEFIPWITESAVSYLNIDVGASGPHPSISASPELHKLGVDTMKKIAWPLFGYNQTMYVLYSTSNACSVLTTLGMMSGSKTPQAR